MELEPATENGKGVLAVLKTRIEKSPESAVDKLKRVCRKYSLEMQNHDAFLTVLYAESVLDESPSVLSQKFSTTLLRVQHAIETALNKKCVKELIVALELSENGSVLNKVLNWTEENSSDITEDIQRLSVNLAQIRIPKRQKLSEITPGTVNPRTREISLEGEDKCCSALEVHGDKVIIGWNNGQIGIYTYSTTDLHCQTVLSYCASKAGVSCLQCTGVEIIAGYSDGNICMWNIKKKTLLRTLSVWNEKAQGGDYAVCMRWRAPRLVVCTIAGSLKIWQYSNNSIVLLGSWDERPMMLNHVDFTDTYVILQRPQTVDVRYLNGQQIRSISDLKMKVRCAALDGNHLITGGEDKIVRIWNIATGTRLKELEGHDSPIRAVDAYGGVIATSDSSGWVNFWDMKAALEGRQVKLAVLAHERLPRVPFLKLGENILLTGYSGRPTIQVTDFLT